MQQVLTDSPFGDVTTFFRFNHGVVTESGVGEAHAPDIVVRRRYSLALGERDGSIDLMESTAGGRIDGDLKTISVFLGIYGTDECLDARRRLTTPSCRYLVALGNILCSRGWAEVVGRRVEESS